MCHYIQNNFDYYLSVPVVQNAAPHLYKYIVPFPPALVTLENFYRNVQNTFGNPFEMSLENRETQRDTPQIIRTEHVPFVLSSALCLFPGVWYHGSMLYRLYLARCSAE